jgi:hypothetical protein
MSKRILAIVSRGMTDKTPVIVWDHETPILEAIHGEGAVMIVPHDDLADRVEAIIVRGTTRLIDPKSPNIKLVKGEKGAEEVEITGQLDGKMETMRLPVQRIAAKDLVARSLGLGEKFSGDVDAEYDRLIAFYGMHHEVKVPVVEYVWGRMREGRFAQAVGEIAEKAAA